MRSFLSGSYCRDTSIRPRTVEGGHERADVDIIVVANFTRNDHPDGPWRTGAMDMRLSASTSAPSASRRARPTWTSFPSSRVAMAS
ncbi:MAG: SMODS domain-containing nucleotidyltransferase [Allosphingosinicella sp.]